MELKAISVQLTTEERTALYDRATRECRRPDQQARYLLRVALGLAGEEMCAESQSMQNSASVRQDLASTVLS